MSERAEDESPSVLREHRLPVVILIKKLENTMNPKRLSIPILVSIAMSTYGYAADAPKSADGGAQGTTNQFWWPERL